MHKTKRNEQKINGTVPRITDPRQVNMLLDDNDPSLVSMAMFVRWESDTWCG
jgi:hypothetical protein